MSRLRSSFVSAAIMMLVMLTVFAVFLIVVGGAIALCIAGHWQVVVAVGLSGLFVMAWAAYYFEEESM